MKTIFLNIWHGNCGTEFTTFLQEQAPTTDIFCFQEADPTIRQKLRKILTDFTEYFHDKDLGDGAEFSIATYVKNELDVTNVRTLLEGTPDTGIALVANIQRGDKSVAVVNVHGIYLRDDPKLDTPGRLVQSETVIKAFHDSKQPVVVGGDFNLSPEADSIQMFSRAGYRDLIADHQIRTTRNRLAWERYPDTPQYYADYVFAGPNVRVREFSVPENEVSDHLPLILEFDTANIKRLFTKMPDYTKLPYRLGALGIVFDRDDNVLIVQLNDYAPDEWNFPGGGRDPGETSEQNVLRELSEELGAPQADFEIIAKCSQPAKYDFPEEMRERGVPRALKYRGQMKDQYFVRFVGDKAKINMNRDELKAYKWVQTDELVNYLRFEGQYDMAKRCLEEYRSL